MASNLSNRAVHRPVKTCTQCKQVKLRCDSRERFPAPCTRCETRGYQCVVDSSFRRTPARRRVEEMAKELEALKNQKHDDAGQGTTESPSVHDSSQHSPDHPFEHAGTAVLDDSELDDQYQLESFALGKDLVVEIFKIFSAFFYPHFPILNPTISISGIYGSSPLLFWTIVAITTTRPILPSHAGIFEQLKEPFMRMFRLQILSPPLPLQTIQALTYHTMYTFPVRSQTNDPSWIYSGVAINAAMYMGLHRNKSAPSLRSIGVHSGSPRARAHTWLGCFLASTSLAKHVGVSAPIKGSSDLATIEQFVRSYHVPPEFAYQIMVNHTLAKFLKIIVENPQETMSISLVKIIDSELDSLETRYPVTWTSRVEMAYLTAKLLLYTTVIIRLQSDRASREIIMRNALSVAVRIAYLTDQGLAFESSDYPTMPPEVLSATLPKNYFRVLVLSTAFLIRFFVLNAQAIPEEQEIARNHVAIAQRYLASHSKDPMDERVRGATLFGILSRQKPINLENSKLRVDDRMGASLVYDAVTLGQELRHEPFEVEEKDANTNGNSADVGTEQEAPMLDENKEIVVDKVSTMDGYPPLDFSLPEDLWGDSIWGMFDPIAPGYQTYTGFETQTNGYQPTQTYY